VLLLDRRDWIKNKNIVGKFWLKSGEPIQKKLGKIKGWWKVGKWTCDKYINIS
jgi:hypothetical protein